MREWARVGTSVRECALVYAGVCGSAWVSMSVCGWDDISECLLGNRVPTSVNFNMYPIQIFLL